MSISLRGKSKKYADVLWVENMGNPAPKKERMTATMAKAEAALARYVSAQ